MSDGRRLALLAGVAGGGLLLLGTWSGVRGRPVLRAPGEGPSILLITLEAFRADAVDLAAPNLADLADTGTRWDRAYTTAPSCLPALTSIHTGLAPITHGARVDGAHRLTHDARTLAERLRRAGWATMAVVRGFHVDRRFGWVQGFDVYHDRLLATSTRDDRPTAAAVVDDALAAHAALRAGTGELFAGAVRSGDGRDGGRLSPSAPAFLWVHLDGPRAPYTAAINASSEPVKSRYLDAVTDTDTQLGRLVTTWRATEPNGLVVVVGDHGESLGEGGEDTHGVLLHDATLHVPLVIAGPGFDAGVVKRDVVSVVDLVPTLVDLLGMPTDRRFAGHDLRDGGSGVAWSEAALGQAMLGAERLRAFTDNDGRFVDGTIGTWHVAINGHVGRLPHPVPLTEPYRMRLRTLERRLSFDADDARWAGPAALDPSELRRLQALGYAAVSLDTDNDRNGDPRYLISAARELRLVPGWLSEQRINAANAAIARVQAALPDAPLAPVLEAQNALTRGRQNEARERLTAAWISRPDPTIALHLADLDASLGRWQDAEHWYGEALTLQPEAVVAVAGQIRCATKLDELERASALLYDAEATWPFEPVLALAAAQLALVEGDPESAKEQAAAAALALPFTPWAALVQSEALWSLGEQAEAIEALDRALALAPADWGTRLVLTRRLLQVGDSNRASIVVAPAARLLPAVAEVQQVANVTRRAVAAHAAGRDLSPKELQLLLSVPVDPSWEAPDTGLRVP
jgi:tetratricopeptide (TPR) repeat protein